MIAQKFLPVITHTILLPCLFYFVTAQRPGKVDSLFSISHSQDFDAGGRSLFIIDYAEMNVFVVKHY